MNLFWERTRIQIYQQRKQLNLLLLLLLFCIEFTIQNYTILWIACLLSFSLHIIIFALEKKKKSNYKMKVVKEYIYLFMNIGLICITSVSKINEEDLLLCFFKILLLQSFLVKIYKNITSKVFACFLMIVLIFFISIKLKPLDYPYFVLFALTHLISALKVKKRAKVLMQPTSLQEEAKEINFNKEDVNQLISGSHDYFVFLNNNSTSHDVIFISENLSNIMKKIGINFSNFLQFFEGISAENKNILANLESTLIKKEPINFNHSFKLGSENIQNTLIIPLSSKILIKFSSAFSSLAVITEGYSKTISFVAHEFRTPLNCIINMMQALELEVDKKLALNFIAPALTSTKFLINMVNDLLDNALLENRSFKLVPTEFDLEVLLGDTLQIIALQAKRRGVELKFGFEKCNKRIKNDPNRVRQVVTNLLSNALKYTTKGSISLIAKQAESAGYIEISVRDTGLGINEEDLLKLFNEFGRITNRENLILNSQGVGLGLVISNRLAIQLSNSKKSIKVVSVPNSGSIFTFEIYDFGKDEKEFIVSVSSHRIGNFVNLELDPKIHKVRSKNTFIAVTVPHTNSFSSFRESEDKKYSFEISGSNPSFTNSILNRDKDKKNSSNSLTQNNRSIYFLNDSFNVLKHVTSKDFIEKDDFFNKKTQFIKFQMQVRSCNCPLALVVDDNDFNILVLMTHLKKLMISADSALSANDAFKLAEKFSKSNCVNGCKNYKILFIDVEMPEKDGIQLFKELKSFYDNLGLFKYYVIAVTGHQNEETRERLLQEGIGEVIVKPLSMEVLLLHLEFLLDGILA